MILARVIGTVVCTQKDERLNGVKLQVVEPVAMSNQKADGKPLVAIDTVGAGLGEVVLVVSGSSARQTNTTVNTPVDAVIMAIVDSIDLDGQRVFEKG
jgi:ethanolamine utilization protein EutN